MRIALLTLALAAPSAVAVSQTLPDWQAAALTAGGWSYRATGTGSEAVFTDASATRRVVVKCSPATRRVGVSIASPVPATSMTVATSETERVLPAVFDPQGFQILAEVSAQDPILDAMAFSRGRLAILVPGGGPLILPAWPEIARSIEDCRN